MAAAFLRFASDLSTASHAEPILQFICPTFGGRIAGGRVSEDCFIVIKAVLTGGGAVETRAP